ncbi:hypothetical protein [Phormidium sp. FACHB-1136]|jgi:hypothetical protein|uniref:hypothetical protein n=1 Tax=Phormidium sp. FACHB-1136 TaxID=2692848 RepID=UPI001683D495|nr:hypothetical protein [Phormidium sp. FACHB-1136]MBD2428727.1 hypothetical protein [Phormidium sp. FACHB-1136]
MELFLEESSTSAIDVLTDTPDNATLIGGDHPTIFVGHGRSDLFVLSATGRSSVEMADIILGFSPEQGDRL